MKVKKTYSTNENNYSIIVKTKKSWRLISSKLGTAGVFSFKTKLQIKNKKNNLPTFDVKINNINCFNIYQNQINENFINFTKVTLKDYLPLLIYIINLDLNWINLIIHSNLKMYENKSANPMQFPCMPLGSCISLSGKKCITSTWTMRHRCLRSWTT